MDAQMDLDTGASSNGIATMIASDPTSIGTTRTLGSVTANAAMKNKSQTPTANT